MAGEFFDLSLTGWIIAIIIALIVGLGKAGIAGLGMVAVPLIAEIFPAGASVGILLPLLLGGDVMGVTYYRRHAVWKEIIKALPLALLGIISGYLFIKNIEFSDSSLKRLIGTIVLGMLLLNIWQKRRNNGKMPEMSTGICIFLGLLGGFTTMAANAAGPVFVMYLLYLGLGKNEFIGTRAWLFLIINSVKIPLQWNLGNISSQSIIFDLKLIPFILIGFIIGIKFLKKLKQDKFELIVKIFVAAAAIKMIIN